MWGVVVWEKQPGGRDTNNPDASKRNRPTLAMPILLDMKKKAGLDQWEGQVYNAKDGQTYSSTMQTYSSTIKPADANHLEIRGCVLGFLCGGESWTRIAPPIPSSPVNSMAKAGVQKSTSPAPKTAGRATANIDGRKHTAAHAPDAVGDICLLSDIAGFAH
jgi:hypothetical protein